MQYQIRTVSPNSMFAKVTLYEICCNQLALTYSYNYIIIIPQPSLNITDGVSGSVNNYTFSYSNITFNTASCPDSICEYVINISASHCPPSTDISVTIRAINSLGSGPSSAPIIAGMILSCTVCLS